jgi:hypothetical protein
MNTFYLLFGAILYTVVAYAWLDFVAAIFDPRLVWVAALIAILIAVFLVRSFGLTVEEVNNIQINPTYLRRAI